MNTEPNRSVQASNGRDHGGDLDRAKATYGAGDWCDLSTGINAQPYPVGSLPSHAWAALPTKTETSALEVAAQSAYGTGASVVALAGAQAVIQLVPRLEKPGRACVVGPTYNEHAAALTAQGWSVEMVDRPEAAFGADLLTLVNPNNPDGRSWTPQEVLALRGQVGLLVVDESFADPHAALSVAPSLDGGQDGIVVMRSFGKFFGLAGLRLGFALTSERRAAQLRALAGPWAVGGPAIAVGTQALEDSTWQEATMARLLEEAQRLDDLAARAGWTLVGGTALFRTYETPDAHAAQQTLAAQQIWTRIFPYSSSWIRLGLPGTEADWARLMRALSGLSEEPFDVEMGL